mmetsp:Transcript_16410/g.34812  ORF Transcript_16410/g.34812 Transcript_16410/m.34812 type:complete len:734 (-) Transcript_16410:841-3042(-)
MLLVACLSVCLGTSHSLVPGAHGAFAVRSASTLRPATCLNPVKPAHLRRAASPQALFGRKKPAGEATAAKAKDAKAAPASKQAPPSPPKFGFSFGKKAAPPPPPPVAPPPKPPSFGFNFGAKSPPPPAAALAPPTEAPPPTHTQGAITDGAEGENLLVVTVPDNVKPGDMLRVTAPSGAKLLITVPDGAVPGNQLEFSVPPKPEPAADTAPAAPQEAAAAPTTTKDAALLDEDMAAVRMQSAIRGHKVRYEMNEQRRLEWLAHYQQPYVAEFDRALALCVTEEEERAVEAARKAYMLAESKKIAPRAKPAGNCFTKCFADKKKSEEDLAATKLQSIIRGKNTRAQRQEENRVEWFKYYLSIRNFEEAKKLAVSPEDFAKIEEAMAPPKPEDLAATKVQSIIRGRKTREEMQEASRLEWYNFYLKSGDFAKAMEMAVSPDEEAQVKLYQEMANPKEDLLKAATKLQSATRGHLARTETQEAARIEWLRFYIEAENYEKAKELVVTQEEDEAVEAMYLAKTAAEKAAEPKPICACLPCIKAVGPPPGKERRAAFEMALEEHDWDAAERLAQTEGEQTELHNHRERVKAIKDMALLGQEEEALNLATTEKEKSMLKGGGAMDMARKDILNSQIKNKNTDAAMKLAVTDKERAVVAASAPMDEATRKERFVGAVKGYEWEKAEALAEGDEELQDVKDSIERVKLLQTHMANGEKDKALKYAITSAEREKVMSGATKL